MCMKWIISLATAAALSVAHAADSKKGDASDLLFRDPIIRTLRLDISPDGLAALKLGNHDYVRATLSEGSLVLPNVGVRPQSTAPARPGRWPRRQTTPPRRC